MKPQIVFKHEFVEFIPSELKDRTIYISVRFGTASHLCACGCGNKVVTPLRPTDWKLIFDGKTISLDPSIGNWSFECKSHYWIRNNKIRWSAQWSNEKIDENRAYDRWAKETYLGAGNDADSLVVSAQEATMTETPHAEEGFWQKLMKKMRLK